MESNLSQELFAAILRAAGSTLKGDYITGGVTIQWDLANSQATGTFVIPLQQKIDSVAKKYVIEAADFLQENT